MGEALVALEGTPAAGALSAALALLAALMHAVFGAIIKGGADPYLNRGAINVSYALLAAPVAALVPWPSPELWLALAVCVGVHFVYELAQVRAFQLGGFATVYPISRGTGPLLTAAVALPLFGEAFSAAQWLGLAALSGGIYGLAAVNLRAAGVVDLAGARRLRAALAAALATGVMVAAYTTWDAYAIRLAADPLSFLAWFFVTGGAVFPVVAVVRWRSLPPHRRPRPSRLAARGLAGGCVALFSFAPLMLATRLGDVAAAAALRETSVLFAAAIGAVVFGERVDAARAALIAAIAAGAVLVTVG